MVYGLMDDYKIIVEQHQAPIILYLCKRFWGK